MRKFLIVTLLATLVLPSVSCRRAVENAARNIRVEGIERVERQGLTGIEAVLLMVNDTRYRLRLDAARIDLYLGANRVGDIALATPVEVPRRWSGSLATQWRVGIADPLALVLLARRIGRNDFRDVFVDFSVEGRGGPAPVHISRERMPLSEFLTIFGLKTEDIGRLLTP